MCFVCVSGQDLCICVSFCVLSRSTHMCFVCVGVCVVKIYTYVLCVSECEHMHTCVQV